MIKHRELRGERETVWLFEARGDLELSLGTGTESIQPDPIDEN